MLLAHPTRQRWDGTYTIPKGKVIKGEDKIDAAIRETKEEVGVYIDKSDVEPTEYCVEYRTKKGYLYKKVYYFIVRIKNDVCVHVDNREINWAGFLTKEESESKIFWRF
ncbi:MAG: NUDIX hydrolase, partial [Candidatus Riesia sp.]|nr:NUDIX hydrolase [Candidatus Riesia sp.]